MFEPAARASREINTQDFDRKWELMGVGKKLKVFSFFP